MQRSRTTAKKTPRIAIEQVEEVLADSGQMADALRAEGFGMLVTVKRAKLVQSRRERARVAARHGEDSQQVALMDRKMALEHRFLVGSRAERDRIKAPILERDPDTWQIHGYLRDQDGFPRQGYTVGVFADDEGRQPALVSTTTNNDGYFRLHWKPPTAKLKAQPPGQIAEMPNAEKEQLRRQQAKLPAAGKPVYVGGRGPDQSAPTMDSRALHPRSGAIAYRDMTVHDEADAGGQCRFATRLLGNAGTRELHTLDNEQAGCRLAAIRPDRRVYFLSEAQAEKLGYDYCAYCFGRERSKR